MEIQLNITQFKKITGKQFFIFSVIFTFVFLSLFSYSKSQTSYLIYTNNNFYGFFGNNDTLAVQHPDFIINFTFNDQLNFTNGNLRVENNNGVFTFYTNNNTKVLWRSNFFETIQSFQNHLIVTLNNKPFIFGNNDNLNNGKNTIVWRMEYYIPYLFIMFLVGIALLIISPTYVIWQLREGNWRSIFFGFAGLMFAIAFIIAYLWTW